ncbi:MAG: Ribonuclease HII [Candidatus Woesebacteria bacterium]|nr:MAG: Ribonuclease HII [Candidatus Woesebacteria bacterium]
MKSLPNFYYEKKILKKGYKVIAGLDEAGRGALAGPLVCAAVVFKGNFSEIIKQASKDQVKINDSKKLTENKRKEAYSWIRKNAFSFGVGVSSVSEINRYGIAKATFSGFRRAIREVEKRAGRRVNFILIDAFYVPYIEGIRMPKKTIRKANRRTKKVKIEGRQLAIIHGDEKSFSIAAASIIAKVYRDKIMKKISRLAAYKKYNWEKNKGYGTSDHLLALKKFGLTKEHRSSFIHLKS